MVLTPQPFSVPILRPLLSGALAVMAVLLLAVPARAQPVDDLMRALQVDAMLDVMHIEGIAYGEDLGRDMLPGGGSAQWDALLAQIYDTDKMADVVRMGFADALGDTDTEPLTAFFDADLGRRIVDLELSARRAMIDDTVEQAARETYIALRGDDDPRLAQINRFVEVNDLLEANVAGALNASFQFYSGLVDGGGMAMSESEILSDVWSQETETRDDTQEWVFAFLLLAYESLTDAELETYITLSESQEGRALNRALFAGFNAMYDEISYALGLAAAQQMQQQEL
jgi:hypothetical protein